MQRTITAAFDSRDAAERAAEALVFRFGIPRADVYDQNTGDSLWGSLGRHHIPDADRHLFAEAVSRGAAIVSASVEEAQLEPAMDLLESHGAWDLDEREQGWRSSGWTGFSTYGGDAVLGGGPALGERGRMHDSPADPPGTMLSRGTDDALGTNMSGARPEHERGTGLGAGHGTSDLDAALTPGDQGERGTMLSRGIDDALGTNLSGARPGNETGGTGRSGFGSDHSAASDASAAMTPGDQGEPGTALSRGVDDALGTNISGAGTGSAAGGAGRDDEAIPVVEERLRVGKREVTHGRVRVRTYVVETPVEEQVRLREEHVRVDRHAVDRPVTDADRLFRERTVEATETSEEAVIAKEARVTEELRLQKEASERTETVRDTVRRTEVEVDNDVSPTAPLPPGGAGGTDPTRRNI